MYYVQIPQSKIDNLIYTIYNNQNSLLYIINAINLKKHTLIAIYIYTTIQIKPNALSNSIEKAIRSFERIST